MKKILCLTLALLLVCGVAFAVQSGKNVSPGTGIQVQQGGYDFDPPKTFRLVRFVQRDAVDLTITGPGTDVGISPDAIVIWSTLSNDGVTVTTTRVTDDSRVAGISRSYMLQQKTAGNSARDDYGQGNWGWIQTYGVSTVTMSSSVTIANILSGDALGTGSTAGGADIFQYTGDIPSTARYTNYANGEESASGSYPVLDSNAQHCGKAGFFMNSASASEQGVAVFLKCE
jgi:hypothetical protein